MIRWFQAGSVAVFVGFTLACGDSSVEVEVGEEPGDVVGGGEPAGSGEPAGGGAATVTLTGLTNGDAACYVDYVEGGEPRTLPGDFELCQSATGMIGASVVLDIGKDRILADSCQGDPECTETQEVDFVRGIRSP